MWVNPTTILTTLGFGSPISRITPQSDPIVHPSDDLYVRPIAHDHNGITWLSHNASLPKILILNAGGTIQTTSNYSRVDNLNYGNGPNPTIFDLVGNYSEILDIAQLGIIEFGHDQGGSSNFNSSLYLAISHQTNRMLCNASYGITGAVLIHGTNSLEETLAGLDATVNCSKPIVATGAMRPESHVSHDGPSNLYSAITVATDPKARDRGALIAFNDRIVSAHYGVKTNGNVMDTFKAMEQGNLGAILGGQPYWFFEPAMPTGRRFFNISSWPKDLDLPSVIILYMHQGFDANLMHAAVDNGAKGIVLLGAGPGQLSTPAIYAAEGLKQKGVPVVASTRTAAGASVPPIFVDSYINSGYLGATKTRIQLQLALAVGCNWEGIRDTFEREIRGSVYNEQTWWYHT